MWTCLVISLTEQEQPEDQWSCKRSPDYFSGITTTVKREKGATSIFLDAQEQLTLWSLIRSDWISNSSKLSWMLSLPASIKRIQWRTAEKNRRPCFSHYKPIRRSRAANSAVGGPIRPNFKLFRALMHVIITCKYKKEWMKKVGRTLSIHSQDIEQKPNFWHQSRDETPLQICEKWHFTIATYRSCQW